VSIALPWKMSQFDGPLRGCMIRAERIVRVGNDKCLDVNSVSARFFEGALVTFDRSGNELIHAMEWGVNQLAAVSSSVAAERIY